MTLRAHAHAKVNLHLEVLSRRPDGYHEIETIFQSIGLFDELDFEMTDGPIHVRCEHPDVPTDRSNLCHRAAKLLKSRLGLKRGVEITLHKNIPVAAGLGGGSADAAACLVALPRLWRCRIADEVLHDILHDVARTLGADVPFFLRGGTQLGRGIGENLTPLSASGGGWYLILTPPMKVSTQWVYEHLRMGLTTIPPKVNLTNYKALLARFPDRRWPGSNRLGDVVFPAHPSLHRLYLDLLETEPQLALLSGSGPSIFAVYSEEESAELARTAFADRASFSWVGRSTRQGVTLVEV
jgi:4-diphosphocytidyl-2-C-methyl-D-erythritol kinase